MKPSAALWIAAALAVGTVAGLAMRNRVAPLPELRHIFEFETATVACIGQGPELECVVVGGAVQGAVLPSLHARPLVANASDCPPQMTAPPPAW